VLTPGARVRIRLKVRRLERGRHSGEITRES
jgi:hypothetical protein